MRFIDTRIIALYQLLVNLSQRKPMWWAAHCVPVIFFSVCKLVVDLFPKAPLLAAFLGLVSLFLCVALYLCVHDPVLWEAGRQNTAPWKRAWKLTILVWSLFPPHSIAVTIFAMALVSFSYLLCCEDPPPPRRRTSTKLSTEGAP